MFNFVGICIIISIVWWILPIFNMSLEKRGLRFPQSFITPLSCVYYPDNGCDWRSQVGWIPMVKITDWYSEVGSGIFYNRHHT